MDGVSRRDNPGVVYLIGSDAVGVVKIGKTRGTVQNRLKTLQTGCPFPLNIYAYFTGYTDLEAKLHRTFRPLWRHGEWFDLRDKLFDFVSYLESYAHTGGSLHISEGDLEAALHDCVWSGLGYPEQDPVAYEASAIRDEWAEMFA